MATTVDLQVLLSAIPNVKLSREENRDAQIVVTSAPDKSVRVTWPHDVGEIFFEFFMQEPEKFSDWVPFYNGETMEEIGKYIAAVASHFFAHPTRVRSQGNWFVTHNIEYAVGDEWRPLLGVDA